MRGKWTRRPGLVACATLLFACACGGKQVDHVTNMGEDRGSGGATRRVDGASSGGAMSVAPAPTTSRPCWANDLPVAYAPDMYSSYIEGTNHVFQVPALAQGVSASEVSWRASDPSMVQIELGASGGVMLTTKKAGNVVITANANGRCGTSTLHIDAATEEDWQAGNARFNNMNPLPTITTDGGIPVPLSTNVLDPPGMPPACTNCHGDLATSTVFRTIIDAPEQTAGHSDQQLVDIITKGADPMDGFVSVGNISLSLWSRFHTWSDIEGNEAFGMVVYLRSLATVAGSRPVDFHGFRPSAARDGGQSMDAAVRDAELDADSSDE